MLSSKRKQAILPAKGNGKKLSKQKIQLPIYETENYYLPVMYFNKESFDTCNGSINCTSIIKKKKPEE